MGTHFHRIGEQEEARIVQLRQSGMSIRNIAKQMGRSAHGIYIALKRAGIPALKKKAERAPGHRTMQTRHPFPVKADIARIDGQTVVPISRLMAGR
jgi:IS30 family transposase